MSPRVDQVIFLTPRRGALEDALRDLGIPPFPFLRATTLVVTPATVAEARGRTCAWAAIPDMEVDQQTRMELLATTRHEQMDFHELVARRLAWRVYHEQ